MAFPRRRRRFDLAVLHRRRGKADRQKHETEKGKAPFHVAATIFVVRGKGKDRDGGHDRGHRFGMVRAKAPEAFGRGAGAHQFDQAEMLPALRRDVRQRRVQGIGRKKLRMLRMRQEVHGLDGHDLRFKKDTNQRMDRVSAPPVRIPFAEDVRLRQQKRGNDRPLLAFQGLRRAPRSPGRGRFVREGLDRREALRRAEIRKGIRQKEIQCERRPREGLPILRRVRDRRRAEFLRRHRQKQAGRQSHAQGIRKANRRMLDFCPRRRKGTQRRHRRARPEKRGPHKRRNPRNEGRGQPFGRDKRPPRQNGEVHAGPFRLRSSKPSGLDESVLAVDERTKRQNGQGEMVPGDGVFQENPHKIPRQIREKREIIGFIYPSFANEVLTYFESCKCYFEILSRFLEHNEHRNKIR